MTTKIALSQAQQQEQQLRVYQLQSLHLLSLSNEELQDFLQQAYRENPLMDYRAPVKNHDNTADIWDFLAAPEEKKIKNYILEQLNPQLYSSQQWTLLSYLAELVDEDGFLVLEKKAFLARCPLPEGLFDSCLAILQSLNPPGICTASVTECLLEQLRRKKKLTPELSLLISAHWQDILKGNTTHLARTLSWSKQKLQQLVAVIKELHPYPLSGLTNGETNYIIPDIIVQKDTGSVQITLNDSWIGAYSLDKHYLEMMRTTTDKELKSYFKDSYYRCAFLLANVERRKKTLLSVATAIFNWQYDYILKHEPLKAMTLADIAEKTSLHCSTVSRAIKHKYIQLPTKTVPLRHLFQHSIKGELSSYTIKKRLISLVEGENKLQPLGDNTLASLLSKEFNANVSRRVIAKYRTELHIPNSYHRKYTNT